MHITWCRCPGQGSLTTSQSREAEREPAAQGRGTREVREEGSHLLTLWQPAQRNVSPPSRPNAPCGTSVGPSEAGAICINLKNVMLSERSQTKDHTIFHLYEILKR